MCPGTEESTPTRASSRRLHLGWTSIQAECARGCSAVLECDGSPGVVDTLHGHSARLCRAHDIAGQHGRCGSVGHRGGPPSASWCSFALSLPQPGGAHQPPERCTGSRERGIAYDAGSLGGLSLIQHLSCPEYMAHKGPMAHALHFFRCVHHQIQGDTSLQATGKLDAPGNEIQR